VSPVGEGEGAGELVGEDDGSGTVGESDGVIVGAGESVGAAARWDCWNLRCGESAECRSRRWGSGSSWRQRWRWARRWGISRSGRSVGELEAVGDGA
jgi:hypothetical protein